MRILHIIGNGFDLNLGLKTSYKDFYEYYKSINSSKSSVLNLKRNISNNYKNWSDLELALGQYTDELKSINEFDEIFEDIGEQLSEYLKHEEAKFDITKVLSEKFYSNLVMPETFLPITEYNKIIAYKNNFINANWVIDVITFNYTTIIDRILKDKKDIEVRNHQRVGGNVVLKSFEHIHGYLDNRMVLGVNDVSQIKNKDFHANIDILEAIVKEKCNAAIGHNIDNHFKYIIKHADLIAIFGASIGDTDNIWWEQIGDRLRDTKIPVIIFTKGEEVISPRIGYKNNRTKRKMMEYFLKKTKLSKDEIDQVSDFIFIALDTSMFKDILET